MPECGKKEKTKNNIKKRGTYHEFKGSEKKNDGGAGIYPPGDEEIMAEQVVCMQKLWEYNQIQPKDMDKRFPKLQEHVRRDRRGQLHRAAASRQFRREACCISGNMCMPNYNLTMVDDTHIYVGDYTMIGPNVTIATAAGHPIDPALRSQCRPR